MKNDKKTINGKEFGKYDLLYVKDGPITAPERPIKMKGDILERRTGSEEQENIYWGPRLLSGVLTCRIAYHMKKKFFTK
jgi:hypothetical protein